LLAEDNAVNQEVATSMLESLGCRVTVAVTGTEAVAAVERMAYDAVLMDMQMPEMDGLAATRAIRDFEARSGRARVPIIALTANAFAKDAEACFAAGMDEYLSKPFTLGQLHARLARGLSSEGAAVTPAPGENAEAESAPPSAAPEPAMPALDRKTLDALRSLGRRGRPDAVGKIMNAYLTSSAELLATMQDALSRGDAATVHRAAHSLKSSSANVGALNLSGFCREMEAMGRAKTLTNASALLGQITAEHARVEVALTDELQTVQGLDEQASALTSG
jgi:CheY-like chemotaxis protein